MRTVITGGTFLFALFTAANAQQPARRCPDGYDPERWALACRVHDEAIVIDTHSDTTSRILDEDFDISRRADDGHFDLPRAAEGGLDAQFYAIYVASRYFGAEDLTSEAALRASRPNASARRALDMIDAFYRTCEANPQRMMPCRSTADLKQAIAIGKQAAFMGIEGGHAIEGDLALLRLFHRLGVRYMTLTHSNHNHFADSCGEALPRWGGLNRLGVKVVREMNRLGMMVDVSHVADTTFFDALAVTRAPVLMSHSSCRALCGHPRNVTDDMLRALAKNGGVVMINFNCAFLSDDYEKRDAVRRAQSQLRAKAIESRHAKGTPEYEAAIAKLNAEHPRPEPVPLSILIDHICHAIDVAGVDHVGLGSDFDGVPCVPAGLEDVSHLPKITYHLLERGCSEEDCQKILGGNLLRVFAAVEQRAIELIASGEPPWRGTPDDLAPLEGR